MKAILAFVLLCVLGFTANAQVYNGNLIINRQAQIDTFNYTEINGNLTILREYSGYYYTDVENLNGLSSLTKVTGILIIGYLDSLKNLNGLNNLVSVNFLSISSNYLFNFQGLDNLEIVNDIKLYSNFNGQNLTLKPSPFVEFAPKLKNINDIYIYSDNYLDLDGLQHIERVNNLNIESGTLRSLHGLEGIRVITGKLEILHDSIQDLYGLRNLDSVGLLTVFKNSFYTDPENLKQSLVGLESLKHIRFITTTFYSFQGLSSINRIDTIFLSDNNYSINKITFDGLQSLKSIGQITSNFGPSNRPVFDFEGLNNVETIHDFELFGISDTTLSYNSGDVFKGLDNLREITGRFYLYSTISSNFSSRDTLNFKSLTNLKYINNFSISDGLNGQPILNISFNGLENVNVIDTLELYGCKSINFTGLRNLIDIKKFTINDYNYGQFNFTSIDSSGLDFMSNIRTIKDLKISSTTLTNLNGLRNIEYVSGNLSVLYNYSLNKCCGIKQLLLSGGVQGSININENGNDYDFNIPEEDRFKCNNIDSIFVTPCSIQSDSINLVEAKLFIDNNNNSVFDANDIAIGNRNIRMTYPSGSTVTNITNNIGKAKFYMLRGSFLFNVTSSIPNYTILPASTTKAFTSLSNSDSIQFIATPTSIISDASIEPAIGGISRPGMYNNLMIHLSNDGTQIINGTLKCILDNRTTEISTNPPYNSRIGDTLVWNITNFLQLQQQNFYVTYQLDSFGIGMNDTLYHYAIFVNNTTDATPANNTFLVPDPIRTSYDPNDKTVNNQFITPSAIANGDYLSYTIRFQNTGNDTAFRVEIRDTLSNNLDWNSLQILGASHKYEYRQENGKYVYFTFNNIMLPDSNVNEQKSHGFISFKIKPKSNLSLGANIDNTGYIYFDLNAPIRTNTAQTNIQLLSNTISNQKFDGKLKVFPNPNNGEFNLSVEAKQTGILYISIIDITGKIVFNQQENHTGNSLFTINSNYLSAGTYLVNIQLNNETTSQKLLITK